MKFFIHLLGEIEIFFFFFKKPLFSLIKFLKVFLLKYFINKIQYTIICTENRSLITKYIPS